MKKQTKMKKTIILFLAFTLSVQFANAQKATLEQTLAFLNENMGYLSYESWDYKEISYNKEKNVISFTENDDGVYDIPMNKNFLIKVIRPDYSTLIEDASLSAFKEIINTNKDFYWIIIFKGPVVLRSYSSGATNTRNRIYFGNGDPKTTRALVHLFELAKANKSTEFDNLKF